MGSLIRNQIRRRPVDRALESSFWGDVVRTVEVRITDDADLVGRLKDMRIWLDGQRFEPSTFTYFYLEPGMMIRVAFELGDEAEAFAHRFGGSLLAPRQARGFADTLA